MLIVSVSSQHLKQARRITQSRMTNGRQARYARRICVRMSVCKALSGMQHTIRARATYEDRYRYPKCTIEWIATKKEPFSHLSSASAHPLARHRHRNVDRPSPLRDQLGDRVRYVRRRPRRLDVVQLPLASPLGDQLPAEDSVLGEVHVGIAARISLCFLSAVDRLFGTTHKIPASEPCIVSPRKYCFSGPLPCSSFSRAMYRYAENAPGLNNVSLAGSKHLDRNEV